MQKLQALEGRDEKHWNKRIFLYIPNIVYSSSWLVWNQIQKKIGHNFGGDFLIYAQDTGCSQRERESGLTTQSLAYLVPFDLWDIDQGLVSPFHLSMVISWPSNPNSMRLKGKPRILSVLWLQVQAVGHQLSPNWIITEDTHQVDLKTWSILTNIAQLKITQKNRNCLNFPDFSSILSKFP